MVFGAWSKPDRLIIVVSPCARQSGEFVKKAREFVSRLGIKPRGDGYNRISVLLPNKSRIVGLPGSEATVRGFSNPHLVVVDEAARVRDDMFDAVNPMLAVGDGRLWVMSTPFGKRGFFWKIWDSNDPEWERISVPVTSCPRISQAFIAKERVRMGQRMFEQEYLCKFSGVNDALFDRDQLLAAISSEVKSFWVK